MATTSAALLRTSTEEDLERQLKEAKEELFNLRFQAATGQLESHGRLRTVRRDIARIYTILRERELGIIGFIEPEEAPVADEAEAEAKPKKKSAKKSTAKKSTKAKDADAADEAPTDEGETTDAVSTDAVSTDEGASADEGDAK
jgi:large subunit ribosomal protein L29